MEKPAIDMVLQALDTFSHNQDPSEQEKASKWLMQLQSSVRPLAQGEKPARFQLKRTQLA